MKARAGHSLAIFPAGHLAQNGNDCEQFENLYVKHDDRLRNFDWLIRRSIVGSRSIAGVCRFANHKDCNQRIRYQKVVPGVGPIDTDEIVKGYEIEKDKYVLLEDKEIDDLKLEAKKTIDLVQSSGAGDEFRLEILQADFTGVKFDISTYPSGIIDPEIKTQPADLTVVEGSDAVLSVAATGSQPLTYQWQFKGNNIQGATGSTLTIPAADAADAGNYTVIVTSPAGSATSRTAVLTVISVPGTVRQGGSGADGSMVAIRL